MRIRKAALMFGTAWALCACERAPQSAVAPSAPPAPPASTAVLDVSPVLEAIDSNKDGCLSHEEWQAAGAPESSYRGLKDDKGCVTAEKMRTTPPPPGIDLDGDGKLTLEEFKEFDRRMARSKQAPAPAKAP